MLQTQETSLSAFMQERERILELVEEIRAAIPDGVVRLGSGGIGNHRGQVVALRKGCDPLENSSYFTLGKGQGVSQLLTCFRELASLLPPAPWFMDQIDELNAELRERYGVWYHFYGEIIVEPAH